MWPWSKRQKQREELFVDLVRAAAEGDRIAKLKESLACLSVNLSGEREETQIVSDGAIALLDAIHHLANPSASEDVLDYVDGLFLMVFTNHMSFVMRCNYELASTVALLVHFSVEAPESYKDMPDIVSEAIKSYNELAQQDSPVIRATGNACVKWCNQPNSENLDTLAKLYNALLKRVQLK